MPNYRENHIRYFVRDEGVGGLIVLLHGFTGSSANWERVTAVLARHFRVVAIDLPGHGRTGSPTNPSRYQMEDVAADVTAVLANVCPTPVAFNLLGYSMGGRLALYIALHYPHLVKSLILESASPGLATEAEQAKRRQKDEALAARIEREGIRPFVNFWENLPLWDSQQNLSEAARQTLRQQRLQNNPTGLANSLRGMGTGAQPSLWPRLSELTMPVLLMAGELDQKFVEIGRQMAAQIPLAQLEMAPGAGHTVHLEATAVFTQTVLNFLHGL